MTEQKKQILLVFGGASPEHEVSCSAAASLVDAISRDKYDVFCVGITKTGEWFLTEATSDEIADCHSWIEREDNKKAILSPDRAHKGLLVLEGTGWKLIHIDGIFPTVLGETGEDGKLPALFDLADIPYVGSGVCASACGMDKTVTMIFSDQCGLKRPVYFSCDQKEFCRDPEQTTDNCIAFFKDKVGNVFPLFVKPATTGSSIGISRVENRDELFAAMKEAARYSERLIVEENIVGRELKVAILGTDDVRTGDICEIMLEGHIFNSYTMKYSGSGAHKIIPADLPVEKAEEIKRVAVDIYKRLGCEGYARVDLFLKDNGDIYFNEINTVPTLSTHSIYPLMFNSVGMSYEELVDSMLETAFGTKV